MWDPEAVCVHSISACSAVKELFQAIFLVRTPKETLTDQGTTSMPHTRSKHFPIFIFVLHMPHSGEEVPSTSRNQIQYMLDLRVKHFEWSNTGEFAPGASTASPAIYCNRDYYHSCDINYLPIAKDPLRSHKVEEVTFENRETVLDRGIVLHIHHQNGLKSWRKWERGGPEGKWKKVWQDCIWSQTVQDSRLEFPMCFWRGAPHTVNKLCVRVWTAH